jgi:hypothetical protein
VEKCRFCQGISSLLSSEASPQFARRTTNPDPASFPESQIWNDKSYYEYIAIIEQLDSQLLSVHVKGNRQTWWRLTFIVFSLLLAKVGYGF